MRGKIDDRLDFRKENVNGWTDELGAFQEENRRALARQNWLLTPFSVARVSICRGFIFDA